MSSVAHGSVQDVVESLKLVQVDEGKLREHLDGIVRGTVQDTLNALLDADANSFPLR